MAEWDVDLSEVNGLIRWYGKQPKLMQKASAMMLNRFAWGTRDESVRQIGRLMIVRNQKFVSSRLRVTKARMSDPIDRQRSVAGSIAGPRFSGWTEQEKGTPTARKRVSTKASRGGDIHKQMLPRTRLKPSAEVVSIGDRTPRGGSTNYGGFVAMLMREKFRGIVHIGKRFYVLPRTVSQRFVGPSIQGGVHMNQLIRIQSVKKEQPKKKHWMRQARAIYFKKNDPQTTWNKVAASLMTPPPKK